MMARQFSKSGKPGAASPGNEVTQDAPTAEPQRDKNGRLLDKWNVPVSGPDRAAYLTEMGMVDPNDDPDAWDASAPRGGAREFDNVPDTDGPTDESDMNDG